MRTDLVESTANGDRKRQGHALHAGRRCHDGFRGGIASLESHHTALHVAIWRGQFHGGFHTGYGALLQASLDVREVQKEPPLF